ncbi:MAG: WG repeat-containing protein [Sediminibacterium sp.]
MNKIIFVLMLGIVATGLHAQDYTLFRGDNKKVGLKDQNQKIIVQAKYDYVSPRFSEGYTYVKSGGKMGFVNKEGKEITLLKYDNVSDFLNGFASVNIGARQDSAADISVSGKWGFINTAGIEITPLKYDNVTDFANGFAGVNIGAKWDDDEEELAGGKWGVINTMGKELTPLKYDNISDFFVHGFAVVYVGKKRGLINAAGKELTSIRYDHIEPKGTDKKIAVVNIGGKYDEDFGNLAYNPYVGGKQGFINCKTGEEIVPVQYAVVADFSEGLAPVNLGAVYTADNGYIGGKWGYVDANGKTIIPLAYDEAGYFHNGKATVKQNGRTFSIDKTGKEIK